MRYVPECSFVGVSAAVSKLNEQPKCADRLSHLVPNNCPLQPPTPKPLPAQYKPFRTYETLCNLIRPQKSVLIQYSQGSLESLRVAEPLGPLWRSGGSIDSPVPPDGWMGGGRLRIIDNTKRGNLTD